MALLFAAIVTATVLLIIGAVVTLRRMQHSATARLLAGILAGLGAWILIAALLERTGTMWPLAVLAALLAMSGGQRRTRTSS